MGCSVLYASRSRDESSASTLRRPGRVFACRDISSMVLPRCKFDTDLFKIEHPRGCLVPQKIVEPRTARW
jgi:hypothetical protein